MLFFFWKSHPTRFISDTINIYKVCFVCINIIYIILIKANISHIFYHQTICIIHCEIISEIETNPQREVKSNYVKNWQKIKILMNKPIIIFIKGNLHELLYWLKYYWCIQKVKKIVKYKIVPILLLLFQLCDSKSYCFLSLSLIFCTFCKSESKSNKNLFANASIKSEKEW